MTSNPHPHPDEELRDPPNDESRDVRIASAFIHQFARTLKTCRLYDANNPAVLRFRDELGAAARRVLEEHDTLTYHFKSDDVLFEDVSLYPARSRDDNLALPFFRDGIRSLTLQRGLEARELDALIDGVLHVTGQNAGEDDLVTLLWEAQLPHVDLDYVPAEGDLGAGEAPADGDAAGGLLPWPSEGEDDADVPATPDSPAAESLAGTSTEDPPRSDDWRTGEETLEIEAEFDELESLAPSEVRRFRNEYDAEHAIPRLTVAIATASAYLSAEANEQDRTELGRFLPRVMRQAVTHGQWLEAYEALKMVKSCEPGGHSVGAFAQELLQPISVAGTIEKLDDQDLPAVQDFIVLARELGDPGVDWLNLVLAESQNRRNRRMIAEAIAERCRANPERLAPWLSDPRWFVVRNAVHILGWIGGNSIIGLLQGAMRNPDARVRQEVVAALGQADLRLTRALLLRMLDGADTRMLSAVLHQLSAGRDPGVARRLMSMLQAPEFDLRPTEEKRAIYSALTAVGGNEIV
ncbi:MAG: HEAT repeat domain-containing protein, partial [Candidatus Eisenbacteria bacterium]|nr:HEAT repeat domain-containing protein [Candidatus Eisenbacteria bacterium]